MSNQLSVTVGVPVLFDGSSTTFSFDLAKHPYAITSGAPNGISSEQLGQVVNYFTQDQIDRLAFGLPASVKPTGIVTSGSLNGISFTASLSGTVVSVTFSSAPPAGGAELELFILF